MKKRILSVLLAALMIIGSVGTFAIGTSAAEALTFSVKTGAVQSDNTVKVEVWMDGNSGSFAGVNFTLSYDKNVIVPTAYDTKWDEDEGADVLDTCLTGTVENKLAEPGVVYADLDAVSYTAFRTTNYTKASGKLIGYTFKVLDKEGFTNLTLTVDCTDQDKKAVVPKIVNSHVGQLSLDDLTLASKTVNYNGAEQGLDIVGLDSEMSVVWKLNGNTVSGKFVNAGTYNLTAVVSKAGYNSKTLTATLTINKVPGKLVGVELWSAVEGGDVEIKSLDAAYVEAIGQKIPVTFSNPKVVKDGDSYKLEGVIVGNTNIAPVDTTVVPNFVAADKIVDEIVEEADIEAPAVSPLASKLPAPDVELPYGYQLVLVPNAYVAEDGTITRPDDVDSIDVDVTYNVVDESSNVLGSVVLTYTITRQSASDSSLIAYLMLLYNQKLAASKTPVANVNASVASGSAVAAGTTVTLTSATEGATIYYTTDGTTATVLSNVYTGPIVVNKDMTINAIAKKSGMKTSSMSTFTYTIAATSVTLKADAANIKYMEGRGDKFEPEANATRYEVIKALANVFDIKTTNASLELTDVAAEYKELVDLCTAAGIIKGYEDKTFRGNESITRAEVATIICNIMGLDVEAAKDAGFTDVSGWAAKYVNACANAGYVKGKGNGIFAPSANITRAELATIINNITGAEEADTCSYDDVVEGKWYYGIVCAAAK